MDAIFRSFFYVLKKSDPAFLNKTTFDTEEKILSLITAIMKCEAEYEIQAQISVGEVFAC